MVSATARSARAVVRRIPASLVLLAQLGLGLLTALVAWLTWWEVVVVGLVLMQLTTTIAVLGPWGSRTPSRTTAAARQQAKQLSLLDLQVSELDQRVEMLGARLVASSERTRVEVLDALEQARTPTQDPSS